MPGVIIMQITKKKLEQILKEEITRMGAEIRRRQLKAVKNYIKANPNPSMKDLRRVGPKLADDDIKLAKRQEQARIGTYEEAKGKKVSGPFVVTKRPDKIKGVTHWAIVHEPSNLYIPSTMYKMKAGPVKALAKELNTNFGDLRSAKLEKEDVEAIKDFILNSEFRDPAV